MGGTTFESVSLGDFNGDSAPDQAAATSRVSGLSGGYVYAPPGKLAEQQNGTLLGGNGLLWVI
ncbi:hypothetical protein ACWDG1_05265 [Streptomyces sp. NPDC001177]